MMYQKIKDHPSSRALYADRLVKQGVLTEDDAKAVVEKYRDLTDCRRQSSNNTCKNQYRNTVTNSALCNLFT